MVPLDVGLAVAPSGTGGTQRFHDPAPGATYRALRETLKLDPVVVRSTPSRSPTAIGSLVANV